MSDATTVEGGVPVSTSTDLRDVALASVVAGVVYGLLLQYAFGAMQAIGALFTFGEGSLFAGWITHVILSLVFALVYAVVTWSEPLDGYARRPGSGLVLGAGYGAVLWFVNIGFIWPVWTNATTPATLPVPLLGVDPLLGHLLWGAVLGVLYPVLRAS